MGNPGLSQKITDSVGTNPTIDNRYTYRLDAFGRLDAFVLV